MGRFLERGGAWVAGQGLLIAVLLVLAVRYPGSGPAIWRIAGVLVLVAAWAVAGAGTMAIGKNLTPFPKPRRPRQAGSTRDLLMFRHPLYTAVIMAGFGWALAWLSWPALIAVGAMLPFFHAKSCWEEVFLRQKFPGYREYEIRTRRVIPWLY
jgi:protein-S-isoprenylcysteine O-methyltransferase Ste14